MTYKVIFSSRTEKQITKLPRTVQRRIIRAIEVLAKDPRPDGVKKLKNSDYLRLRVGDYRVIYLVKDREIEVLVLRVAHRREAYR